MKVKVRSVFSMLLEGCMWQIRLKARVWAFWYETREAYPPRNDSIEIPRPRQPRMWHKLKLMSGDERALSCRESVCVPTSPAGIIIFGMTTTSEIATIFLGAITRLARHRVWAGRCEYIFLLVFFYCDRFACVRHRCRDCSLSRLSRRYLEVGRDQAK